MATVFKWIFTFIICIVLQTTIIPSIAIWGRTPDIILIALFLFSLRHGVFAGIYVGFIVGLTLDLYSPSPTLLGQQALAKTVVTAFFGLFNEKIMRADPVMKIIILAAGFFFHDILFSGAEMIILDKNIITVITTLFSYTLPRTLYTMVILAMFQIWDIMIKPNLNL